MARRRRQEGGTPALDALAAAGVPHAVRPYDHDAAASAELGYGEEAARALGADPARVFKTLVASAGDGHVLAVVPVAARLDLKALARAAGNPTVERLMRMLFRELEIARDMAMHEPLVPEWTIAIHTETLEAVRSGDAKRVAEVMGRHLGRLESTWSTEAGKSS